MGASSPGAPFGGRTESSSSTAAWSSGAAAEQVPARGLVGAADVGEPLHPVPLGGPVGLGQDGDAQVGRAVVDGKLADDAPGEGEGGRPVADDTERVAGGQVGDERGRGQPAELGDGLFDLDRLLAGGRLERRRPGDTGGADRRLEEVVVGRRGAPTA